MNRVKVLLVEDDPNLGFVIKDHLDFRGYITTLSPDGHDAWEKFQKTSFDICVLDIMLPKKNGFELLKSIREMDSNIPVIFISARALSEDKITGLKLGADDYVIKPFSIEELVLRIEVFINRPKKIDPIKNSYKIGNYMFNYLNQELIHKSETIAVTNKEAEILKILCMHMEETVKREDILKLIWGEDDYFMGRSLDVYVSRIRKYFKLDNRIQIANVFAVGFRLVVVELNTKGS
jgi:DNA-binding response OmpR family regulator